VVILLIRYNNSQDPREIIIGSNQYRRGAVQVEAADVLGELSGNRSFDNVLIPLYISGHIHDCGFKL
jgi:hypothetical protein